MSNFIQVTPFMSVSSLEGALAFFCGVLSFEVSYRAGDYAYVRRESVGIRLMEDAAQAPVPAGDGRYAYYVDVHDVDALYEELRPKLAGLPAGHVHGPLDQPYGQRELTVVAPDGNLLVFGQMRGPRTAPGAPISVERRDLTGSRFTDVRLASTAFGNVDLSKSTFSNVNASAAAFRDVSLRDAHFTNVDLSSVRVANSRLGGMRIEGILVTDLIAAYRSARS